MLLGRRPTGAIVGPLRRKQLVNVEVVRHYLDDTRRAIEKAAKKESIKARQPTEPRDWVESICKYLALTKNAN